MPGVPTITNTSDLKIDTYFVDGDSRTITLKNPKDEITTTEITALNQMIQSGNLLIGDQTGATFGKIKTVTRVTKVTTNYGTDAVTP